MHPNEGYQLGQCVSKELRSASSSPQVHASSAGFLPARQLPFGPNRSIHRRPVTATLVLISPRGSHGPDLPALIYRPSSRRLDPAVPVAQPCPALIDGRSELLVKTGSGGRRVSAPACAGFGRVPAVSSNPGRSVPRHSPQKAEGEDGILRRKPASLRQIGNHSAAPRACRRVDTKRGSRSAGRGKRPGQQDVRRECVRDASES
jgi:hypothetical protein